MWHAASSNVRANSLAALVVVFIVLATLSSARADITNYEFRLVGKQFKAGSAIVSVRLVHKPDDKAAPDAVIFATRLDMAPEGMETMKATIEPASSAEPGVYRFKVDLSMEGGWRLSLAAKIQGETGTLENRLVLRAMP
jgi:hypothetical protein